MIIDKLHKQSIPDYAVIRNQGCHSQKATEWRLISEHSKLENTP